MRNWWLDMKVQEQRQQDRLRAKRQERLVQVAGGDERVTLVRRLVARYWPGLVVASSSIRTKDLSGTGW